MKVSFTLLLSLLVATSACESKKPIWIYTSYYNDAVNEMKPKIESLLPGKDVKWFIDGSERIAETVNAEISTGLNRADVVVISDPFLYLKLKEKGELLSYQSAIAKAEPKIFDDVKDHNFTTNRLMAVTIAVNSKVLPHPGINSWKDLTQPKWKNKISMGNPQLSGTTFTAASILSKVFGWDYFKKLKENNIVFHGSSTNVVTRLELGDIPVGILLLEDALKAKASGAPIEIIYPQEGPIVVPGYIAIMKKTHNEDASKKIYDWFLSSEAQAIIVKHGLYSPFKDTAPPLYARPLEELLKTSLILPMSALSEISDKKMEISKQLNDFL